jgi:vancomycin resistance protein YoaR
MTVAGSMKPEVDLEGAAPSRFSWFVFEAKRQGLRWKRRVDDLDGEARRHRAVEGAAGFVHIVGQSQTALWTGAAEAERRFEFGKVQNLRVAAAALDGVVVPAGGLFSFWGQVGPPTTARGFAEGRMLQQGCMVASVGGGLCQLSNSLYDVALQAGCVIIERHRHSRIVPGSQAEHGRDATVAWNYVDLRFRPQAAMRLAVGLDAETLTVTLSQEIAPGARPDEREIEEGPALAPASSCASCGKTACRRHEGL